MKQLNKEYQEKAKEARNKEIRVMMMTIRMMRIMMTKNNIKYFYEN